MTGITLKILKRIIFFSMLLSIAACDTKDTQQKKHTVRLLPRSERLGWWRDAKFGMMIHWGLYSIPAGTWAGRSVTGAGEWIMANADIPRKEYDKLAQEFNPGQFEAKHWVDLASGAGVKYLVMAAKHHDGFGMFNSRVSEFDVTDATPFGRDIMAELSAVCWERGIEFGAYYSILDWHHPALLVNLTGSNAWEKYGMNLVRPGWKEEYVSYIKAQIAEVIGRYEPKLIWFDGGWPAWWRPENSGEILKHTWAQDPNIIVNNRIAGSEEIQALLGDFVTLEEFSREDLPDRDWELILTLNDTRGFKANDRNWKTARALIYALIDIVSSGGNLLLIIGPDAEGKIPEAVHNRLAEMGSWLAINGEAIYGSKRWLQTHEGPQSGAGILANTELSFSAQDIRFTMNQDTIYAIALDWPQKQLKITAMSPANLKDIKIRSVRLLGSQKAIEWQHDANGLVIKPPTIRAGRYAFVFKIVTDKMTDR